MSTNKVYEMVTEKVIKQLEQGIIPWQSPYLIKNANGYPYNAVSKRHYRGINLMLLAMSGFSNPRWMSFKQAQTLGGCVRKGEKGSMVVYWKMLDVEDVDKQTGEKIRGKIPFLRYSTVFNCQQIDGLPEKYYQVKTSEAEANKVRDVIAEAEAIINGFKDRPYTEVGAYSVACYIPSSDSVQCPSREYMTSSEDYYSTMFHELVHSTGHEKRLGRLKSADNLNFGSSGYAKEELVAELGGAFLSAQAGFIAKTVDNTASYIATWLGRLKKDVKLLVLACSQATKAVEYITGKSEDVLDSDDAE